MSVFSLLVTDCWLVRHCLSRTRACQGTEKGKRLTATTQCSSGRILHVVAEWRSWMTGESSRCLLRPAAWEMWSAKT